MTSAAKWIIIGLEAQMTWEAKTMQKITSAYANKMLRSLEEDKAFWVNKEAASSTYVAAVNEEPVIPEYDYMTVANMIDEIDRKIVTIKHALNLTNATAKVQVGEQEMSIDGILIRMAHFIKTFCSNIIRDARFSRWNLTSLFYYSVFL